MAETPTSQKRARRLVRMGRRSMPVMGDCRTLKFTVVLKLSNRESVAAARASTMSKPTTPCVFCGKPGKLTKGHITPKWFLEVLPNPADKHGSFQGLYRTFKPDPARSTPFAAGPIRQGRAGSRKPRNTCFKCNGGWMSRIEEEAKSVLRPLIEGHNLALDAEAQTKLARLICLIAMRAEFTDDKPAIPEMDRNTLRETGNPPPDWRIWICKFAGTARGKFWYTRSAVLLEPNATSSNPPTVLDTQTSMFVWGRFCTIALSSTVLTDRTGFDGQLHRIWPVVEAIVDTKKLKRLDDRKAALLADALLRRYS